MRWHDESAASRSYLIAGAEQELIGRMNSEVENFIREQRQLLERVEVFSMSPQFELLASTGREVFQSPSDAQLASWLLQPIFGMGKRPIDLVDEPDGLAQVVNLLQRTLHGGCV